VPGGKDAGTGDVVIDARDGVIVVALLRSRANPGSGNCIGSVRLVGQRVSRENFVVDAGGGIDPSYELSRGHLPVERRKTAKAITVIGAEEEELISTNRAAERSAELVVDKSRLGEQELVARVQVFDIV